VPRSLFGFNHRALLVLECLSHCWMLTLGWMKVTFSSLLCRHGTGVVRRRGVVRPDRPGWCQSAHNVVGSCSVFASYAWGFACRKADCLRTRHGFMPLKLLTFWSICTA
jgi:hypothetical protein